MIEDKVGVLNLSVAHYRTCLREETSSKTLGLPCPSFVYKTTELFRGRPTQVYYPPSS